MKNYNLTKVDLLQICRTAGCLELTAKNTKFEIVKALNDKYGYARFIQSKTNGGQTYEARDTNKAFVAHSKICNDMKTDQNRVMHCPCCKQELSYKKFKNLGGGYYKYCKDCRELKHG